MARRQDPQLLLKAVVCRCFPPEARVIAIPRQAEAVFAVSWPLHTDAARPAKRSKIVRLSFASELLDHYIGASAHQRRDTDRQISAAIRSALTEFDPDHEHAPHEDSTVVEWTIGG